QSVKSSMIFVIVFVFFSSRRRHTRSKRDWSSDVCSSDLLRKKIQEAGLDIPVTNASISKLQDDPNTLVVTQIELHDRAEKRAPSAEFVSVENFMNSPKYQESVDRMTKDAQAEPAPASATPEDAGDVTALDLKKVDHIIFACDAGMGSSAMGASVLRNMAKKADIQVEITNSSINNLKADDATLIVTQKELYDRAVKKAPQAQ